MQFIRRKLDSFTRPTRERDLFEMSLCGQWDLVRTLLVRHPKTSAVAYRYDEGGKTALFYAAEAKQLEIVGRMLRGSSGDITNISYQIVSITGKSEEFDIFGVAAFVSPDPQMLELLLAERSDHPKASKLRGCVYLALGMRKEAARWFFDGEEEAEICELLGAYVALAGKSLAHVKFWFSFRETLQKLISAGDFVSIVSDVLTGNIDTAPWYEIVSAVRCVAYRISPSPEEMCDVLEAILTRNSEFDLVPVVQMILKFVLDLRETGECCESTVSRLAALVDGFEAKNELLVRRVAYALYADPDDPFRYVPFLVDRCRCDPNYENQDGDFALHNLFWCFDPIRYFVAGLVDYHAVATEGARFLLARGSHPCVRGTKRRAVLSILSALGLLDLREVRSLKCLAASRVAEEAIEYDQLSLPESLHSFVRLH